MIAVRSYPLGEINYTIQTPSSTFSGELIKYLWVDLSQTTTDHYVEITYNGIVKTLLITDECRYTPIDIVFQNKEGASQIFTMFKVRKDTISVTSDSFEGGAPLGKHQFNTFNVQSRSKFTINSGFVTEDKNEAVKQLLLSEKVWVLEGGQAIPISVSSKSQEFKTRQNDRLINYSLEFEYAFNDINNV
jgi:hypothetical protein